MKLTDINKKIILSIALIIGANIFALGVLGFAVIKIRKMNESVILARSEILLKEKENNEAKALKAELLNLAFDKDKIDAIFIGQKDIINFIEEIESLAKKTKVDMEFKSVDVSGKSSEEKPIFQFKASGAFSDIFHYLVLLENAKYQVVFDSISLQKRESKEFSDIWEANFTLRLLSYNGI